MERIEAMFRVFRALQLQRFESKNVMRRSKDEIFGLATTTVGP
jgi:hypothetical protein